MTWTCWTCGAQVGGSYEHCTATGCHQTFTTTRVGDRHRVGPYEPPGARRCLTPDEMRAARTKDGRPLFTERAPGVWAGPPPEPGAKPRAWESIPQESETA